MDELKNYVLFSLLNFHYIVGKKNIIFLTPRPRLFSSSNSKKKALLGIFELFGNGKQWRKPFQVLNMIIKVSDSLDS